MATSADVSTVDPRDVLRTLAKRTMRFDFTIWFWGDAIAFDGLVDAAELLDDPQPRDFCLRFFERWARRPPAWADYLTPGPALLRLYEASGNESLLDAARRLATWYIEEVPQGPGGLHFFRPDLPQYRTTVLIDSLYHVPPFFSRLAKVTGEKRLFDEALAIWNSHDGALCARERGPFLYHNYDVGAGRARGYGWGRGNGWALYGLLEVLELLPPDHPGRPQAVSRFQELAAAVLEVQDASGFWRTLMDDREAYLESSTAGFYGALFTKAKRLRILDNPFADAADRAWRAALSRIDDEGNFFGVSAVTWASTAPTDEVSLYKTMPTEANVWGQGSALRLAAERIRSGLA